MGETSGMVKTLIAATLLLLCAPLLAEEKPGNDPIAHWLNVHSDEVMQGTLAVMLVVGDNDTEDAAALTLDGTIGALGVAEAMKLMIDQPRPRDPSAADGFPSSHAATAFAFARGLSDWRPSWTTAAYTFAAGVGWARVEDGYHTAVQVLAGAAIGVWIAGVSLDSDGFILHGGDNLPDTMLPLDGAPAAHTFGAGPSVVLWKQSW